MEKEYRARTVTVTAAQVARALASIHPACFKRTLRTAEGWRVAKRGPENSDEVRNLLDEDVVWVGCR